MGRNADNVAESLADRLRDRLPRLDWATEYGVGSTRVDVAGRGSETVVLVELAWRRADPADNAAKLFRHVENDRFDADRIVVVHLFSDYYALAGGGVSSKRRNAEFVGRRAADADRRVVYRPVTLDLDPPTADGDLPDDWTTSVERAADSVADAVGGADSVADAVGGADSVADGVGDTDAPEPRGALGQSTVADFLARHDLSTHPAYHALDLAAEAGEVAAAVNETTDYGDDPSAASVPRDELGDTLFATLALCESLDVDCEAALDESITKYEDRIAADGSPDSGSDG